MSPRPSLFLFLHLLLSLLNVATGNALFWLVYSILHSLYTVHTFCTESLFLFSLGTKQSIYI